MVNTKEKTFVQRVVAIFLSYLNLPITFISAIICTRLSIDTLGYDSTNHIATTLLAISACTNLLFPQLTDQIYVNYSMNRYKLIQTKVIKGAFVLVVLIILGQQVFPTYLKNLGIISTIWFWAAYPVAMTNKNLLATALTARGQNRSKALRDAGGSMSSIVAVYILFASDITSISIWLVVPFVANCWYVDKLFGPSSVFDVPDKDISLPKSQTHYMRVAYFSEALFRPSLNLIMPSQWVIFLSQVIGMGAQSGGLIKTAIVCLKEKATKTIILTFIIIIVLCASLAFWVSTVVIKLDTYLFSLGWLALIIPIYFFIRMIISTYRITTLNQGDVRFTGVISLGATIPPLLAAWSCWVFNINHGYPFLMILTCTSTIFILYIQYLLSSTTQKLE